MKTNTSLSCAPNTHIYIMMAAKNGLWDILDHYFLWDTSEKDFMEGISD